MLQKLNQWWVAIVGMALVILDLGFDVVNPILIDAGITGKWLATIKVLFGIYGIYRLYKIKPMSVVEGPGGSNPPPGKDEK